MLLTTEVIVTWHHLSRVHYESFGYKYTKKGDKFSIPIEHLHPKATVDVLVECDYKTDGCKLTHFKRYAEYTRGRESIPKDCCDNVECMKLKREESMMEKHGVKNSNQIPEAKQKREQTCFDRYGAKTPLTNDEIRKKIINTNIEKYGVENVSQVEEIKEKKVETCQEKYGVDNPLQFEEFKLKSQLTSIKNYGFTSPMKNKIVSNKSTASRIKSQYKNKTGITSIQQNYLCDLLEGELNYPFDRVMIDIAFPSEKIYIEYDGGGHNLAVKIGAMTQELHDQRDLRKSLFIQSKGWKEIRIVSDKDRLPSEEKIVELIDYAKKYLHTGRHYIRFDIDKGTVKTSQYEIPYDFGELFKIRKNRSESNSTA